MRTIFEKAYSREGSWKANGSCWCLDQEIGALNRGKNAVTHPVLQIPGYATAVKTLSHLYQASASKCIHVSKRNRHDAVTDIHWRTTRGRGSNRQKDVSAVYWCEQSSSLGSCCCCLARLYLNIGVALSAAGSFRRWQACRWVGDQPNSDASRLRTASAASNSTQSMNTASVDAEIRVENEDTIVVNDMDC